MNNINLEDILKNKVKGYSDGNGFYGFASFVNQDQLDLVLDAMKDACEQCIDVCAEEALIKTQKQSKYGKYRKWSNVKDGDEVDLFSYNMQDSVDKGSILKVKNKICK